MELYLQIVITNNRKVMALQRIRVGQHMGQIDLQSMLVRGQKVNNHIHDIDKLKRHIQIHMNILHHYYSMERLKIGRRE